MSPSETTAFGYYHKVSAFIKSVEAIGNFKLHDKGMQLVRGFYDSDKTPEETSKYIKGLGYTSRAMLFVKES